MKIKTIALSIIALVTIALMAACTSNKEGIGPEPDPDPGEKPGTEVMVNFAIRLPAHAKPEKPSTFAITEKEEDHVKSIEVLLFSADGYTGKPYYCSVISDDGGAGITNKKKFTIALPIGGPYTIVLLANSKNAVDLALKGKPALKDKPKSEILELLEKEQIGKWNTTSDTDFDPMPMWGEMVDITVKRDISLSTKLTRMVSRVDIDLAAGVRPLFKLKKVHLYNRYTKGMIAPYELSWNGAKASDPSIPTGALANTTPQIYDLTNNISLKGEIYAFEAPVEANDRKSTCLILEGEYDGTTTFYRVDFATKEGSVVKFISLLRNHTYNITISAIKGLGAGSAQEAFEQGTGNAGGLDYDIIVIDDSDITTVIYNGKHMLGFSQDEFLFSKQARTAADTDNILMVVSNAPDGWKIEQISYETGSQTGWLSVPAGQMEGDGDGNKKNVSLLLTENMLQANRVGYLHFSAKSLKHKVKVTQRFGARLSVDKALFDDIEGFGIGTGEYYSYKIDSVFNITSNTSWTIVSSHPGVLSVDRDSGTGDSEIRVILQPSSLYIPKDDYTLTITGIDVDAPVVVDVTQFGMDIYVDNDRGTATRAMPDANFVAACKAHTPVFDGGDNKLSIAEALSDLHLLHLYGKSIADLKGIEYFRKNTYLECSGNQLTSLDMAQNLMLTTLSCGSNLLTTLDVTKNVMLTELICTSNLLTELDVTANGALTQLACNGNQLTLLDLTANGALGLLSCYGNQLTTLDMTANGALTQLVCYNNQLTLLDLTTNKELTQLNCNNNPLTTLDVTKNVMLTQLYCDSNQLSELDVTKNVMLWLLNCNDNQLTELDVTQNVMLTRLYCGKNQITELDVTKNVMLWRLDCGENSLTTLDVRQNVNLSALYCNNTQLTSLDVTQNVMLTTLDCGYTQLTSLDVIKNVMLTTLYCYYTQLTTLDVTKNVNLTYLSCGWNKLPTLNVTQNVMLTMLECSNNILTLLDVTQNVLLESLYINIPSLTEIDISKNINLTSVGAVPSGINTIYVWWSGGLAGKPASISFWQIPSGATYLQI